MSNPQDRTVRTWLAIAILFSLFWVLCLAFFGPRPPKPSLEDSGTGELASYAWTSFDLEDRPATLTRFKGKPVFLNIWATWCGPCVQEMPSIARLADHPRLKGKGIEFVCISIDDSTEAVRQFLAGRSWNMHFFRAEQIPPVFLTDGIPATFIIAPDGRIAAKEIGSARWDSPETIAFLEKLAAESPRSP
jgi:thiol-disulfide isomerase/thioredoxin